MIVPNVLDHTEGVEYCVGLYHVHTAGESQAAIAEACAELVRLRSM